MGEIARCSFCDGVLFSGDVFYNSDGTACICRSCIEEMSEILFSPDDILSHDAHAILEKVELSQSVSSCADCPNHAVGSIIDGIEHPNGWHCTCFDICGNHPVESLDNIKLCVATGLIE